MENNFLNVWDDVTFEDTVAAALIACYETKFKKNKGSAPSDRLTEERVALIRNSGPYLPGPTRIVLGTNEKEGTGIFDVRNDPLPQSGCMAMASHRTAGVYLTACYVRRGKSLGKYWFKQDSGTLFEMFGVDATNNGFTGDRRFFTVNKEGVVKACIQMIPNNHQWSQSTGRPVEIVESDPTWRAKTAEWGAATLQILADRRFCWSITAQEKSAKAHLGCMKEEIKSLLYARSLPMTATGRKRPILHLVESHRRRMQSGTEVDITAFLRGAQTVELGGTLFTVRAPETLKPELSAPSVRNYYEKVLA